MPKEQVLGLPLLVSDLYAVGMIGIQCLIGQHPNELFDYGSNVFRWQHLCQISPNLVQILEKMLAQRPHDRYQNTVLASDAVSLLQFSILLSH